MSHATLEKHFSGLSSPVEADGDFVFPLYVEHALRDWRLRRTYLSAQMETCKRVETILHCGLAIFGHLSARLNIHRGVLLTK